TPLCAPRRPVRRGRAHVSDQVSEGCQTPCQTGCQTGCQTPVRHPLTCNPAPARQSGAVTATQKQEGPRSASPPLLRLLGGRLFPQSQQFSAAAEVTRHVDLSHSGVTQAPDGEPQVATCRHHLQLGFFQLLVCVIQGSAGVFRERCRACSPHTAMITPLGQNCCAGLHMPNRFGIVGVKQDTAPAAPDGGHRQPQRKEDTCASLTSPPTL